MNGETKELMLNNVVFWLITALHNAYSFHLLTSAGQRVGHNHPVYDVQGVHKVWQILQMKRFTLTYQIYVKKVDT